MDTKMNGMESRRMSGMSGNSGNSGNNKVLFIDAPYANVLTRNNIRKNRSTNQLSHDENVCRRPSTFGQVDNSSYSNKLLNDKQ